MTLLDSDFRERALSGAQGWVNDDAVVCDQLSLLKMSVSLNRRVVLVCILHHRYSLAYIELHSVSILNSRWDQSDIIKSRMNKMFGLNYKQLIFKLNLILNSHFFLSFFLGADFDCFAVGLTSSSLTWVCCFLIDSARLFVSFRVTLLFGAGFLT